MNASRSSSDPGADGIVHTTITLHKRRGADPVGWGWSSLSAVGIALVVGLNALAACDAPEPSGSPAPTQILGFPETDGDPLTFELAFEFPSRDEPDLHHFGRLGDIQLEDHSGTIYAFERADRTVLAIDPSTRVVRAFGGEGDGPGEFRQTLVLQLVENRLEVYDSQLQRITAFEFDGTLIDTRPAPQHVSEQGESSYNEIYPLRYGWSLGVFTPENGDRELWAVHVAGGRRHLLSSYPTGRGFVFPQRQPEVILGSAGLYGAGGAYGTAGDSMVVVADTYRGRFEWYRVEPEGLVRVASRDLGWTPAPVDPTESEDRMEQASDLHDMPATQLEARLPPYQGRAHEGARVARNGDVWLTSQTWRSGTRRPDVHQYLGLVVPMDPGRPVRSAELPENFSLMFATDSITLGVHRDPVTGEGRLHAYSIQWSR